MKVFQVREAKAKFAAIVEAAELGEPITITRHGRPAAMLVPMDAARKLYPDVRPSFADLLLAFPGDEAAFERDKTPLRDVDL